MRVDTIRLLHPFPSLLVATVTALLLSRANHDAPLWLYAVLGMGMLLFQCAIGVTNDIVDADDDRLAKPWKPLARGDVSMSTARSLAVGCAAAGLVVTIALPATAWAIGALGLACGLAYDLRLKRTALSWLPYSVALPLVPTWVFVAADRWRPGLWWTLPLGAAMGLALHLANQAPDASDGPSAGLAGRLGERASRVVSVAVFAIVSAVVAGQAAPTSPARAALVALVASSVIAAARWYGRLGRDGLFGVLAVGSACLAMLYAPPR